MFPMCKCVNVQIDQCADVQMRKCANYTRSVALANNWREPVEEDEVLVATSHHPMPRARRALLFHSITISTFRPFDPLPVRRLALLNRDVFYFFHISYSCITISSVRHFDTVSLRLCA